MPTPGERKALLFLGAVIVLGGGMRATRAVTGHAPADKEARAAIDAQIDAVESARKSGKKSKGKGKKPKKPKGHAVAKVEIPSVWQKIDLDIATEEQIESLRGIGPAMAKRVVADRDSLGPFGSLKGFERVRGIGPKLAAKVDSSVTFSLVPRLPPTESGSTASQKSRRRSRRGD